MKTYKLCENGTALLGKWKKASKNSVSKFSCYILVPRWGFGSQARKPDLRGLELCWHESGMTTVENQWIFNALQPGL